MPEAVIAIGSNLGNRLEYLQMAVQRMQKFSKIIDIAPLYETTPYGFREQPDFLNSVIIIETDVFPHELLHRLKEIEIQLGRKNRERWGPREIDLDIIFYNNQVIHDDELTIPHPDFKNRIFVLKPLADIRPEWRSPIKGKPVRALLNKCQDETIIQMVQPDWYANGVKV